MTDPVTGADPSAEFRLTICAALKCAYGRFSPVPSAPAPGMATFPRPSARG